MKQNESSMKVVGKLKQAWFKRPVLTTTLTLVLLLIIWGAVSLSGEDNTIDPESIYTVKTGSLRISITETGSVEPKEKIVLENEVEGESTIIYIVDEGSQVKEGDLLIELDSSTLTDNQMDQEITVLSAEASYIDARENISVVESQSETNVDQAELDYQFAKQDLEKYIEGEYPNQLKEAEANITLAEEELAEAEETVEWSRKLYEEQFVSASELESDELAYKKKELDLELAKNDLDLLVNYTHKRELASLESDVKQTKMALERSRSKATANVVQAEASFKAKEAEYERQKSKLEKIEAQLGKTKIYSPAAGQVIYATSVSEGGGGHHFRRQEPLELGGSVSERQELIHLPTEEGFIVTTSIPEATIDKVKEGLLVLMTFESIPGTVYSGRVSWVSPVVDAQTSYMNSDLKIYETHIALDQSGNLDLLRSDMECDLEVVLAQFEKATYVPIESVLTVGGEPTVYLVKGDKLVPQVVETGLDDGTVIQIAKGLEDGDQISTTPPLDQGFAPDDIYTQFAMN